MAVPVHCGAGEVDISWPLPSHPQGAGVLLCRPTQLGLLQTSWLEPQPGLEDRVETQKRTQVKCGVSLEKANLTINLERRG